MPDLSQQVAASLFAGLRRGAALWLLVGAAAAAELVAMPAAHPAPASTFAIVDGRSVPTSEFENAFASLIRQKFYHGKVPAGELAAAREEVKTRLVQRIVLLAEAERRGLRADAARVDATLAEYDQRNAASAAWRAQRVALIAALRQQLEELSVVGQLEEQVRRVAVPLEAEARAFHAANAALFTEPEKLRLSVILLAVNAAAPAAAWDAARSEAQAIFERLAGGAAASAASDFAEAARLHSAAYAESGGDFGYVHRGMLPEALHEKIDGYRVGALNPPLDSLQGVLIVRLDERVPARARPFAEVAERARELCLRERQDHAWSALVGRLVAAADVRFLQAAAGEQREGGRP